MRYVTITGHRFWSNPEEEKLRLFNSLEALLTCLPKEVTFIGGCAYGVDTWFLEFARTHNIDIHMYFPFTRIIQIKRSKYDINFFKELNRQYELAKKVVYVNKTFHTYGYQRRNLALVDNADILCTYFSRKRSGSGNCYRYALFKEIPILDLRLEEGYVKPLILRTLKPEFPVMGPLPRDDKLKNPKS